VNREQLFQALVDSQTVRRIINGQPDDSNRAILGNVLAYIDTPGSGGLSPLLAF
jgi:hypothetical protein